MGVGNFGFGLGFFSLRVTHWFCLYDEGLLVKDISIGSEFKKPAKVIQVIFFIRAQVLIGIGGNHIGIGLWVFLEVVLMKVVVIVAHGAEVKNIAETFFEPGSVDSFQIDLGLGLNFVFELFLHFFPVLLVILDQFYLLRFSDRCYQLFNLGLVHWVSSFEFSFLDKSQ